MATISNNLTGNRSIIVTGTVHRVEREVGRLTRLLRVFQGYLELMHSLVARVPPLPANLWTPLQRAFQLDQANPISIRRISMIARRYHNALQIIQNSRCLLSLCTGENYCNDIWGFAASMHRGPPAGFAYEIELGRLFFEPPQNDPFRRAVHRCAAGIDDVGLLRASTLVHESIHFLNAMGGHHELGMLRDPFNYDFFLVESSCIDALPIERYRERTAAQASLLRPRVAGRTGQIAQRSMTPLGTARTT